MAIDKGPFASGLSEAADDRNGPVTASFVVDGPPALVGLGSLSVAGLPAAVSLPVLVFSGPPSQAQGCV